MTPPRRRPRGLGAPSALTDETRKRLIEATERGVPVEVAAQYAGIHQATFHRWCARGRDVEDLVTQAETEERDPELSEEEELYYSFWQEVQDARARATVGSVINLQRAAAGGTVTKVVTRRFRDSVTGQIVEETTEDRAAPEWRASAWLLERGPARQMFAREPTSVELSGVGGGPVEIASVDVTSLAARVQENMQAALQAGVAGAITTGADDGIQDAEVVDDDGDG